MAPLLSFLLRPSLPMWKFCLAAFPLALFPSLALFGGVLFLFSAAGVDTSSIQPPSRSATAGEVFGSVIFAPVVETYLLALILRGLLKATTRPLLAATASAVVWGAFHGLFAPLWFFGSVWSFFVFSCAFIGWQERSFKQAYIAAAVPHALINLTVIATVALENAA